MQRNHSRCHGYRHQGAVGIRLSYNGGINELALNFMPKDRYSKQIFIQEWNIKPHRGRQG